MENRIEIRGLAALSRSLKQVDADAPKRLRIGLNAAAQLLVDKTRPEIPSLTGRARGSLTVRSTRTAARVGVGGKRAPYYPWLDFGGQGRVAGRPAPRPFIPEGRYVYPTLSRIRPDIEKVLLDQISALVADAGLQED